jgi:hypothetical protein
MSQLLTTTATRPPAFRDRDPAVTDQAVRDGEARRSRLWTVLEALAYAGAYIDPSGILAVERLRRAQEEEEEHHGRR